MKCRYVSKPASVPHHLPQMSQKPSFKTCEERVQIPNSWDMKMHFCSWDLESTYLNVGGVCVAIEIRLLALFAGIINPVHLGA